MSENVIEFNKVNKILQKHLEVRHINGGYATKIKYELEQIPELNIKKIITSQTHIKLIGLV